ncbi:MAG: 4-(cytidine 5'-diphospho)-2-C-methyl-D-erythritol kinase [Turicibacter sp.]|nr:4-(cytidine 5'-diphospho)-2-C-methyl-D-erythritol kinase [Turicibacter sp.]MBQ4164321.1 4-(cytidine 5'-diphospho)-2-C-methyl-D-erythritol kinase [Turicibacter sp.]MEE0881545.1 4-(cytidine 5'-diphospho)-2-C-methyl-D-erythritol kinase [Turicibacter sp.]MEE1236585.1 4-(cytidine 5'-diphospho)-2-C-methyl-D-erythritol kinase [Turicibacter sp.]
MVTIKAPAKINLALDTLYKRKDNYHEVEMIMTTVDLADYITVTSLEKNEIIIKSNEFTMPLNEKNLAYKAAKLFKEYFNIDKGVEIYIKKRIPVAAGLAGGSSNAAATLKALKELWNVECTIDELAELGAKLGSDVPFCVYGGTALATGRGEIIQPIPSPPKCWVILIKPRIGVSTKEIYEALDAKNVEHLDIEGMLQCINEKDYEGICNRLGNSLEEVTLERYPVVAEIKNKLVQFGADAVLMSGSGPTVFALVRKEYKLRRIINSINGCFRDHEVHAVRLIG